MDLSAWLSIVIGILGGFAIAWFFGWQASRELGREAAKLRRMVTVLAQALEREGLVKDLRYDEAGNLSGLTVYVRASTQGHATMRVEPLRVEEITPPEGSETS